jgi:hypothetical protein
VSTWWPDRYELPVHSFDSLATSARWAADKKLDTVGHYHGIIYL